MKAKQIANALFNIACGNLYDEAALRAAKELKFLTNAERAIIDRYMAGTNEGMDYMRLQEIAIRIHQETI